MIVAFQRRSEPSWESIPNSSIQRPATIGYPMAVQRRQPGWTRSSSQADLQSTRSEAQQGLPVQQAATHRPADDLHVREPIEVVHWHANRWPAADIERLTDPYQVAGILLELFDQHIHGADSSRGE